MIFFIPKSIASLEIKSRPEPGATGFPDRLLKLSSGRREVWPFTFRSRLSRGVSPEWGKLKGSMTDSWAALPTSSSQTSVAHTRREVSSVLQSENENGHFLGWHAPSVPHLWGLGSHSTSTDCSAKKGFGETYIIIQTWGGPHRDPQIHSPLLDYSSPAESSLMLDSLSLRPLIRVTSFASSDIFLTLLAPSRSHSWPQPHGTLWEFTTFPLNTQPYWLVNSST